MLLSDVLNRESIKMPEISIAKKIASIAAQLDAEESLYAENPAGDNLLVSDDDADTEADLEPCPICSNPEVEPETGFCSGCNQIFNGSATATILGLIQ